jgi:hypothetical protein
MQDVSKHKKTNAFFNNGTGGGPVTIFRITVSNKTTLEQEVGDEGHLCLNYQGTINLASATQNM